MRKIYLTVLFYSLFIILAKAQDEVALVSNPGYAGEVDDSPEADKSLLPFDVSGFVDLYYLYSFKDSPFPTSFTEDFNSFSLGMANLVFSREGKVGFVVDLAVGPRAEVANGFSGTTLSAIKQLYVTYSPSDWLKFTLGNYGTHVGYEVIDAPANINYSTSYMFSNGPFYHTGLKADFTLSPVLGAMVGLFDDTDSKLDITPGKHLGAQLSYSGPALSVFLNYIGGKDVASDSLSFESVGHQIDLTATYQATEKLGFGLNATNKTNVIEESDNTSWYGAALYANYAFSEVFTLGLRGEYIGDPDGEILGAVNGDVLDLTVSGNVHIGDLLLIPEFRVDLASDEVFSEGETGEFSKSLPAFLVAAVYAF